jgi:hypothetical protein
MSILDDLRAYENGLSASDRRLFKAVYEEARKTLSIKDAFLKAKEAVESRRKGR